MPQNNQPPLKQQGIVYKSNVTTENSRVKFKNSNVATNNNNNNNNNNGATIKKNSNDAIHPTTSTTQPTTSTTQLTTSTTHPTTSTTQPTTSTTQPTTPQKPVLKLDGLPTATMTSQEDAYRRVSSFHAKYVNASTDHTATVSHGGTSVTFHVALSPIKFSMNYVTSSVVVAEKPSSSGGGGGGKDNHRKKSPPFAGSKPAAAAASPAAIKPRSPLTVEWKRTGFSNVLLPIEIVTFNASNASPILAAVVQFLRVLFGKGAGATLEDRSKMTCNRLILLESSLMTEAIPVVAPSSPTSAPTLIPVRAYMLFSSKGEKFYNDMGFVSLEQAVDPELYGKTFAAIGRIGVESMFAWIQTRLALVDESIARNDGLKCVYGHEDAGKVAVIHSQAKIQDIKTKLTKLREFIKWAVESLVLFGKNINARKANTSISSIVERTAKTDCDRCTKLVWALLSCADVPIDIVATGTKAEEICSECEEGRQLFGAIVYAAKLYPSIVYCDL